jgi:hypothetical protein
MAKEILSMSLLVSSNVEYKPLTQASILISDQTSKLLAVNNCIK